MNRWGPKREAVKCVDNLVVRSLREYGDLLGDGRVMTEGP